MTNIKVVNSQVISKGGRQCDPFDFYTIKYKGWMQEGFTMMKVLDSNKINKGKPITF